MSTSLTDKPKARDPQTAPSGAKDGKEPAWKSAARGMSTIDQQLQMVTPVENTAAATQGAPAGAQAKGAPADKTAAKNEAPDAASADQREADELRSTVASTAKGKIGTKVMQEATPGSAAAKANDAAKANANFTTCVEFARGTMNESTGAMYKDDHEKAKQTSSLMGDAKNNWEGAQALKIKADTIRSAAKVHLVKRDEHQKTSKDAKAKADDMRVRKDGESDAQFKQRSGQAGVFDKQATLYDGFAKKQQSDYDELDKKATKLEAEAEARHQANTAVVRAEPGLGKRPKSGEFVIMSQGPEGKMYGKDQVWLHAGAFRHIAVFMGLVSEDATYETWQIAEGGGELAELNEIRVNKQNLCIITKHTAAADATMGSAQGSQLAGWIDAAALIKARGKPSK